MHQKKSGPAGPLPLDHESGHTAINDSPEQREAEENADSNRMPDLEAVATGGGVQQHPPCRRALSQGWSSLLLVMVVVVVVVVVWWCSTKLLTYFVYGLQPNCHTAVLLFS